MSFNGYILNFFYVILNVIVIMTSNSDQIQLDCNKPQILTLCS